MHGVFVSIPAFLSSVWPSLWMARVSGRLKRIQFRAASWLSKYQTVVLSQPHDWTETLRLHVPWTAPRKYSSYLVITPYDIWVGLNTKEGEKRMRRANNGNQNSKLQRLVASKPGFIYRWPPNREEVILVTLRQYTGWNYLIQRHLHVGFSPTASQPAGTTTHLADIAHGSKARDNQKTRPSHASGWKHPASLCRVIKGFL